MAGIWIDAKPIPSPVCPACGGHGRYIIAIGTILWFRCMACGEEFNKTTDEEDE